MTISFSAGASSSSSTILSGYLHGLTLSNNSTDATNSIDVASGFAADTTSATYITLASSITKDISTSWSVGTGNGGLDTGTIADGTYHIFLIERSDTGVVDALASTSPTSPTMPTNYDYKRRIGSIIRSSSANLGFRQIGDVFKLSSAVLDRNSTTTVTNTLITLTVPSGIKTRPFLMGYVQVGASSTDANMQLGDGDASTTDLSIARATNVSQISLGTSDIFVTNTASQILYSFSDTTPSASLARIITGGWMDGRDQS